MCDNALLYIGLYGSQSASGFVGFLSGVYVSMVKICKMVSNEGVLWTLHLRHVDAEFKRSIVFELTYHIVSNYVLRPVTQLGKTV